MSRTTPVSAGVLQRGRVSDRPGDLTAIANHFPRRSRMSSEIYRQAFAPDSARELAGCLIRTPVGEHAAGRANHTRSGQVRRRTSPSLTLGTA